ncbi:FAD-binding domain-containing protein [Xylaria sp. FL1042]|nr:FAD-binding domain-containing protein [Xylaria sp. FL1042]
MQRLYYLLLFPHGSVADVIGSIATSRNISSYAIGNCTKACNELSNEFKDRLHFKENDANFTIWDQKQLQTIYSCRVEPTSADEVSSVLSILTMNWCRFAVKCGGHSRFPDDSVSVGGVTIDMGRINTTLVSEDQRTARVGGGSTSRQVFGALEPYGLAYLGGRVGQVGMGGFTLGGGTSVLSAKYGWALDNVFEYEIVLPNATIVTVNETQHPELYFALRGGGNNFGIVTSFTVGVFPQPPVYTGSRVFGDNQTSRFLEEAEKVFTLQDEEDTNLGLEYTYSYSPAQDRYSMSSTQRYALPVQHPSAFDALNQVPAETDLLGGINSLANNTRGGGPLGLTRNVFTTLTHYPSQELSNRAIEIYKEEVQAVRNVSGITAQLITYTIPATAIRNMGLRGGNALGIKAPGHLLINLLAVGWTNQRDDATAIAFADSFIGRFREAAVDLEVFHPFIYINYASPGQDVFSGYGNENQKRLVAIQEAIDPWGIFTSKGLWRGFFKVR